ncbi:AAA family ATPase [Catellatospora sichuanensis]|uniref:AAA family ATPase n=1 Tax=Catellatospora sichuanensis TaxID=1969805 RepID=UPI001181FE44|nr:AAA family ATPase [Catellatospora sichuanensis]
MAEHLPTLAVISGPPGTGKTTLAHELARALGCPAVCRDEIKEGMAHAIPGYRPRPGDEVSRRVLATFFAALRMLLESGTTVVAEAAFQDRLWRPGLEPLTALARMRVIRCTVSASIAEGRIVERAAAGTHRAAHDDDDLLRRLRDGSASLDAFNGISLGVPTLVVDTTRGYSPQIRDILAFVNGPAGP